MTKKAPLNPKLPPKSNTLWQWLKFQLVACKLSLSKLAEHPWGFIITNCVIALGLSLPIILFLLLKNISPLQSSLTGTTQISVFTHTKATDQHIKTLGKLLEKNPNLKRIDYIGPKEALDEFKAFASFQLAIKSLAENPLPGVYVVEPKDHFIEQHQLTRLAKQLSQLNHVESVQLDLAWAERLMRFTTLSKRIFFSVSILLGLALTLIIYNSLRLLLNQSHDEIRIMAILGGTRHFIQRPYLYLGAFYGFTSALLSLLIIQLIYWWLKAPVDSFSRLYHSQMGLQNINLLEAGILIIISMLLSSLSAWLTTRHYLKKLQLC
ncbi:permease-like cell division protein FtsX [Piscirickettsia salmonis]|uniref:permease-like cell division protein FtsX n=1 Tax=Piscirickettsia salmonis TaxID=1238 RepID=UPI0037532EAB